MGNFARSLGLARVTPVVGGYGFGSPHSLGGAIPVISSDPWIARRWGFQKRPQNTVQYKYSTWKKPSLVHRHSTSRESDLLDLPHDILPTFFKQGFYCHVLSRQMGHKMYSVHSDLYVKTLWSPVHFGRLRYL